MASLIAETTGIKQPGANGKVHEYRLAIDTAASSNQPLVLLHCYTDGVLVGTACRLKDADGRIAMDCPGVAGEFFITEDGHIANG